MISNLVLILDACGGLISVSNQNRARQVWFETNEIDFRGLHRCLFLSGTLSDW